MFYMFNKRVHLLVKRILILPMLHYNLSAIFSVKIQFHKGLEINMHLFNNIPGPAFQMSSLASCSSSWSHILVSCKFCRSIVWFTTLQRRLMLATALRWIFLYGASPSPSEHLQQCNTSMVMQQSQEDYGTKSIAFGVWTWPLSNDTDFGSEMQTSV
jgi:hypothetical protein